MKINVLNDAAEINSVKLWFLVAAEPAKPEEKPKPTSPAKATPVAKTEEATAEEPIVEETKKAEPVVVAKTGRGRPKKVNVKETAAPVPPKEEEAPVAAVDEPTPAASSTTVRRPGRPKKSVAPESGKH